MTSLPWNRPICTPGLLLGLKLLVVFELIGILTESNVLSFFEHNMRFLCYSAALCIQINRFQSEGHVKNVSTFEFLSILNKKIIFLSVFITIIILLGLTINIRSTVLKKGVFRSV